MVRNGIRVSGVCYLLSVASIHQVRARAQLGTCQPHRNHNFRALLSAWVEHMTYGIILWGNSSYTITIFRIQKKIIRIMLGLKKRDSCRDWFKMIILPLCSQYILYSLMLCIINNIHLFVRNTEVHNINTRQKVNLLVFPPNTSFT
jgi:hypothetical protein